MIGRVLKKIFLIIFTLIICLGVLELLVRFLPQEKPLDILTGDEKINLIYKKDLNEQIPAENGQGTVLFVTNDLGFVGQNWSEEKNSSTLRIANLGDSFTAAAAVPYQNNYVSRLGQDLAAKLNRPVESLNFGVGGQGTKEALSTYQNYAKNYNPDLVILWFYLGNDFTNNLEVAGNSQTANQTSTANPGLIKKILSHSALADLVKKAITRSDFIKETILAAARLAGLESKVYQLILPQVPLELKLIYTDDQNNDLAVNQTKEYLKELKAAVAADGKKFALVMMPANFQVEPAAQEFLFKQYLDLKKLDFDATKANSALIEIAKELAIPYFDLTPAFAQACADNCSLYICRYCHLAQAGHDLTATQAGEWLKNNLLSP